LDGRGIGGSIPGRDEGFFLCITLKPVLVPTHPMCREIKQPGHDTNHSPTSIAKVNNEWCHTFTSPYIFMAWWLLNYSNTGTTLLLCLPIGFIIYSKHSSNEGIICPKGNDVVLILLVN
jgi:hypothetical protein